MAPQQHSKKNPKSATQDLTKVFESGSGKIKKKIRDTERLLKRDKLPANVRVDNERTLKALKVQLKNIETQQKTKKIAKKYHMVRFFERKKATRQLKQAKKALEEAESSDDKKAIKKARTVYKHKEVELAYTILFPKSSKYVSLYPNSDDKEEELNEKAKKGLRATEEARKEFKKQVKTMIDEDKLPFSLEDVLKGKSIAYDQKDQNEETEEIDAPVEGDDGAEDDFFEEEL